LRARSCFATTYQDGTVFHAASLSVAAKLPDRIGFCVAASSAASSAGTSAANSPAKRFRSTVRKPATSCVVALLDSDGYFAKKAFTASPGSGAIAATNTKAFTLGFPAAAPLIIPTASPCSARPTTIGTSESLSPETTEPQWQPAVRRAIEAYRRDKRELLFAAFAEVRERHGADSLRRFERALTGYLREWDARPPDARQRPKLFWFPDLPPGPYHDPMLQPWAATLRGAWQDIRDEAAELLREDRDFVSFLGLKPGQRAPKSIGGAAANPAWDAFFFYNHGVRYDANHERCPRTSALLESIELCRVARQAPEICFSLIRPQSSILPHYGVTNTRLVFHLPLVVPPDCALNVGGVEHRWREGEPILFDDTYEHEAWNRSDQPRLILLMDCWNPHLTEGEKEAVRHVIEAIDAIEPLKP